MPIDFARAAGEGLRLARSAFFGTSLVLAGLAPALSEARAAEDAPVDLATASSYAVLADRAVANVGQSVITGDVGVHPGTQLSGFPPGVINGERHIGDAAAERAQSDLTAAYGDATGRTASRTVGPRLEGQTLTPGVYKAKDNANLSGTLTLDAQGNPSAVFIFQLGAGLTTAQNSDVRVINSPTPACNVFWTVADSATLGTNTAFVGHIMAINGIQLESAAKVEQGGALSRDGVVSLDTNAVSRSECAPTGASAPPPTAPASPTSPPPSPTESPTTSAPVTPGTTAPETGVPTGPERVGPPSELPGRRVGPPSEAPGQRVGPEQEAPGQRVGPEQEAPGRQGGQGG